MADDQEKAPAIHREPAIPVGTCYTNVKTVREVVRRHDGGEFYESALLVEQMLWNPRLRGVLETRLNGLMSTAIRWEPGQKNAQGRRAVAAIEEDWPLIADTPTRKQLHEWGLMLGACPAQRAWYRSGSTGREIPRVQVYHPQWMSFDWGRFAYRIRTEDAGTVDVTSPSLLPGDDPLADSWIIHEPFGQHSWRRGLFHAAWYAWLGHEWSSRDQSRASEKVGIGIIKAKYPHGTNAEDTKAYVGGIRKANSEAVIPCAQFDDGRGFDAEALEFNGSGYDAIHRTKDSKAVDLAVLFLGHNLTTEAKGGSYAAANVGDLIRGDIKSFDATAEAATFRRQVLAPWAERNFGDPELAPIPVHETDPPAINLTAAQTLQQLSQATASFAAKNPQVDTDALFDRFRVPRRVQVQVPAAAPSQAAHVALVQSTPPAPATTETGGGSAAASATLAITATDLASIVKVNEGRKSVGLPPVEDDIGGKWIREHGAELASKLPADPGATGQQPEQPPASQEP